MKLIKTKKVKKKVKTIYGYILINLLGWKIKDKFPDIKKSIVIFAPHTSYWDGLYGKLFIMQFDINYKFLSKKEFFKFPMKYFFKAFGSIPVYKNKELGIKGVIRETSDMKETMTEISKMYKNVNAKYPKNFILDKRYS